MDVFRRVQRNFKIHDGMFRIKKMAIFLIYLFAIAACWELIFQLKLISPSIFCSPYEIVKSFPSIFDRNEFLPDLISTVSKSFLAFIYSIPIGIVIGFLIFNSGKFKFVNEFYLDFIRSIPATALIPFFLIIFGIGEESKIAIGTYSSALIIALSTLIGLKNTNKTRIEISKISQFSTIKKYLFIYIPESSREIFIGLRTGVSLALILVVVSEMFIGSNNGLGKVINDMRYRDSVDKLYVAIIATGLIGYLYNIVLSFIEKKIIHWKGEN